jgi:hypothetical protein
MLEDAFKRYAAIVYFDLLILNKADTSVKFCQRCARFRQASTKLGVPCAIFCVVVQFELRRRRNGNATSLLLAKPGQISKTVANNSNFFGGGALWRHNPTQGASNV